LLQRLAAARTWSRVCREAQATAALATG
jgi:hypothetical protein